MPSFQRRFLILAFAVCAQFSFSQEIPKSVQEALDRANKTIAEIIAIPDSQRTFENTLGRLDAMSVELDNATSLTAFMQFVSTNAGERDSARATDEAVSNFGIELAKREDLYKAIKAYAESKPNLTGEQKRILEFTIRDYHLSGMDLPEVQRNRLKAIEVELNKLGIQFEQNINEDASVVPLFESELKGVPKDVIERQQKSNGLILFGLDGSSYGQGIENSRDRIEPVEPRA